MITITWNNTSNQICLKVYLLNNIDQDYGALGGGRRADIVLLNDNHEVQNTWFGGELLVENKKITELLDQQLENNRYTYPKKAYETVKVLKNYNLIPALPTFPTLINTIKTRSAQGLGNDKPRLRDAPYDGNEPGAQCFYQVCFPKFVVIALIILKTVFSDFCPTFIGFH